MFRAYLLQNSTAGRLGRRNLAQQVAAYLHTKGWEVTVFQPNSARELSELASQAVAFGMDAVIVMGGDGTVNLVIRALVGTSTALAVIPTGTANVWALEIGMVTHPIPSSAEIWPAVELLADCQKRQVDVGLANGKPFLLWAGVGLDGLAISHIEPRARWSKWVAVPHYAAHVIAELVNWRGMNLTIEVDGQLIKSHCITMIMANAHRYMGGMTELSPQMRLDDGMLDAWLIEGTYPIEALDQAFRLMQNRHHWDRVQHLPFKKLRAWAEESMWLQVDGEPVLGLTWPLEVEVRPRGLWVLAPPSRDL